jgi:hypothetical protein
VRLEVTERGALGVQFGSVAAICYAIVGAVGMLILVRRLGGLAMVLNSQAAWAAEIKALGLGRYYGLTYLLVIGCEVLAMRAVTRGHWFRALAWFLVGVSPAVILGRRIIILFAALPLLAVIHYHHRRLHWRHMLLVTALGLTAFVLILLLRLRQSGTIIETVATSYELALYDALVAAVARHRDLADLNIAFYMRHQADFWGSNTGALFLQRISGYQFEGGAAPPTAVGTLWVYFGVPGLIGSGILSGALLARFHAGATAHPVHALIYGMLLFFWFDFLRNGDIVLGGKLLLRYLAVTVLLLLCFYRARFVDRSPGRDGTALDGSS